MRARRKVATLALAAACSTVGLIACSLVVPSDGLTGGAGANGDASAPSDPRDARAPGLEASSTVDGAPLEASAPGDAGDSAAPAGPSFCARLSPSPLFCDDFDVDPLAARWDGVFTNEGEVTLSTDRVRSPPLSLRVSSDLQSGLALTAYVERAFAAWTARPMTATLDVDVLVERAGASEVPLLAIQLLEAGGKLYEIQLRASGTGSSLSTTFREHTRDGSADSVSDRGLAQAIAVGAWTHLQLAMSYRIVQSSSARVVVDGLKVMDATITPTTIGGTPRAALGITAVYGPTDPWAVHYDNAVFDAAP